MSSAATSHSFEPAPPLPPGGKPPEPPSVATYQERRKPRTPVKHGTLYSYKRQLCRCDECRAANAAYSQRTTDHERHRIANRRWYATRGKAQRGS